MSITTTLRIGARTDVGQIRDHNEDNFVVCKDVKKKIWNDIRPDNFQLGELGSLLMVADGMGGAEAGEEASRIAIETVQSEFSKLENIPKSDNAIYSFLKKTIVNAHQAIVDEAVRNPNWYGMGTTAILAWVIDNRAYLCWSGDSRCYKYNDKGLELLMDEHSYVWQTFVKSGKMTAEEARNHPESNLITQNLGDARNTPRPDVKKITFKKGDRILLCSDGLNGMISDEEIESIIAKGEDLSATCQQLVDAANNAGGDDNITLVLMDIDDLVGVPTAAKSEEKSSNTSNRFGKSMASKAMLITGLVLAGIVAAIFFGTRAGETEPTPKPGKSPTKNIKSATPAKDDSKNIADAPVLEMSDDDVDNINSHEDNSKSIDDAKANQIKKNKNSAEVSATIKRMIDKVQEYRDMANSVAYVYSNEAALNNLEAQSNVHNDQYKSWLASPSKDLEVIAGLLTEVRKLEHEINEGVFIIADNPVKETPFGENVKTDQGTGPSNGTNSIGMDDLPSAAKEKNKSIGKEEQSILKKAFRDLLDKKFLFGKDPHYVSIRDYENVDLISTSDRAAKPKDVVKGCEAKLKEISRFLKANIEFTEKNTLKALKNPEQIRMMKYADLMGQIKKYDKNLDKLKTFTKDIKVK